MYRVGENLKIYYFLFEFLFLVKFNLSNSFLQ